MATKGFTSVGIPNEVYEDVRVFAFQNRIPISEVTALALKQYLKQELFYDDKQKTCDHNFVEVDDVMADVRCTKCGLRGLE